MRVTSFLQWIFCSTFWSKVLLNDFFSYSWVQQCIPSGIRVLCRLMHSHRVSKILNWCLIQAVNLEWIIYLSVYSLFQMQQLPWPNTGHNPYQMSDNTCMAPNQHMPNFMSLSHAGNPLASYPVHGQSPTSMGNITSPELDPRENTELRSSSIAALRYKAREHSVSMGLFGAYTKWTHC